MNHQAWARKQGSQSYPKPVGVHWLPRPVALSPGRRTMVLGVTTDSPKGLLRYWQREGERRGEATA